MGVSLQSAQEQVDQSIQSLGGYWSPLANIARLFEECGELARLVNQQYGPKIRKQTEQNQAELSEELGDTLYVLITLANSLNIDLEQSLAAVLDKYQRRDAK